jgi:hypothetical protein
MRASHHAASSRASVRSRQVSHREFDLAVGKLPPVFDDRYVAGAWKLIEDFADFQTSRIKWEREYLRLLNPGHSVGQITGANQHATSTAHVSAGHPERPGTKLKNRPRRRQSCPR